jgi:UDP-N-acetylglucosamine 2-epimerase (non-hydrolysing)/GDP/UDP-N,N'-diacetylbacillosamine 2-epimerase (hydrolysing)
MDAVKKPRTIGVVTVARSDYGIYSPILQRIQADPALSLHLVASGSHLSPDFGLTVRDIEADGFEIGDRVEMLLSSDSPEGISKSMGIGLIGFSQSYARLRPDFLMVLGDRFEMHAAALAALPFKIPVAHIHGGEITEGAFDDALRHSMTKLSHLHFASTRAYAERIIQLGEEPWRVIVSGAPGLDNLTSFKPMKTGEMKSKYGLKLDPAPFLVTFHPVTLAYTDTRQKIREVLRALDGFNRPVIFTAPNADTNGRIIRESIDQYAKIHPDAVLVENLGTRAYFTLMTRAAVMIGNSSSGIIEAPSFGLPVVNIGNRQRGRVRGENVIDVMCKKADIAEGIQRALEPAFRNSLAGMKNPYGEGRASEIIVENLKTTVINERLIIKKFHNLSAGQVGI